MGQGQLLGHQRERPVTRTGQSGLQVWLPWGTSPAAHSTETCS